MLSMLHHISVESQLLKAVKHSGCVDVGNGDILSLSCLLDSGALHASYIRKKFVEDNYDTLHKYVRPCKSQVTLADKNTIIDIEETLKIPVTLKSASGHIYNIDIDFMVMESLGEEAIIGLPSLVGPLLPLFIESLQAVANGWLTPTDPPITGGPNQKDLNVIIENPWTFMDETAIEDDETPLPCAFTGPLHFLTMSRQEALDEYHALFETHIDKGMLESTSIVSLLKEFDIVFVPTKWTGVVGIDPLEFNWKKDMPQKMMPRARPVNPRLMENAKAEFDRLKKYFYVPSTSPVASCLVIAPKATAPYIRFCGDYATMVNHYIETGHYPIPHVFHSLEKISKFKKFFDLDMSNSFHQFPLAEKTRRLLSIQTPWGQYEPLFLPEGVPPASGILQKFVYEVFADFEDWIIVIFDNFLVLANDYKDGFEKLSLVLARCRDKNLVLKFTKSWIGFDSVEFFGYKCSFQTYCLTDKRKDSILQIPMPVSVKTMQSFLGCSLFFSKFVPNFSERTAPLHDMTHKTFVWDKKTWTKDYPQIFDDFKQLLLQAVTLHYPDYEKPWILRVDASDLGVGYVLLQLIDDALVPILFGSKKFSEQASRWDAFNKEAYAIYFGVKDNEYYLRPVPFQLDGDHRNLAWMETSVVPKVIRWRIYLQGFTFVFNHISGKKNVVADWQSRLFNIFSSVASTSPDEVVNKLYRLTRSSMKSVDARVSNTQIVPHSPPTVSVKTKAVIDTAPLLSEDFPIGDPPNGDRSEDVSMTREKMLQASHGGRSGHFGVRRTWSILNEKFPGHGISYAQISEFISECVICQKIRLGMTNVIVPVVRHLKTSGPRRVVGIDYISLEPDDYHMIGAYVARDHFSKIIFIYAVREQSSVNAATTLFLYSIYYGCFDYLISDPGTEFTSALVAELNTWYGIHHRVSLVDRHQSNGIEGGNKDFLRHIRAFLCETRFKKRWSEPNIVGWCTFLMNKFADAETGISPYTLVFGSDAAKQFTLPVGRINPSTASSYLRILDEDLEVVKKYSLQFQNELVKKRVDPEFKQNMFQKGDLVLFEFPKDKPLPSKLNGKYAGPFEVLNQVKNDVTCRHCATGKTSEFFVGSLQLFIGNAEDAHRIAMIDADQFKVDLIFAYKGDPMQRMSMEFLVRFADQQEIWLPWSQDLFDNVQYEEFIRLVPALFPLLLSLRESKNVIATLNKTRITAVRPGEEVLIDIRCYGADWYDSLPIPDRHTKTFVAPHVFGIHVSNGLKIYVTCPLLQREMIVNHLFVKQYGISVRSLTDHIVIDSAFVSLYPTLLNPEVQERSASDYQYLVGKSYIDDDDNRKYEVTKVYTDRRRFIVAEVKRIKVPYSASQLVHTPFHIADVERMYIASNHL